MAQQNIGYNLLNKKCDTIALQHGLDRYSETVFDLITAKILYKMSACFLSLVELPQTQPVSF